MRSLCTSFDSSLSVSVEQRVSRSSIRTSSFLYWSFHTSVTDTESLLADVESCDEDGDEAGVVEEEFADNPGTTNFT